ncbi:MAG: phosphate ABC transporter ATP-binding protein [Anaerolineae bacterium]
MNNDLAYRLDRVVKSYGGREVLHVDSLEIHWGEIFGIVGPSGSGKSTLLRLLDFLEPPTAGQIHFQDYSFNGAGSVPLAIRRQVTTVFQKPVLLNTTVYGNVAYGVKIRGGRGVEGKVKGVLARVGLTEFAGAPARTLSGGEAQRVALARAMVVQPQVLLLDEPTANLDPYNVGLIEGIVADLNRRKGTTIVLVTHNVFQAKRLAHRVALLLEGRIIEVAPAERFFSSPSDPRTLAFVRGEMVY